MVAQEQEIDPRTLRRTVRVRGVCVLFVSPRCFGDSSPPDQGETCTSPRGVL